MKKVRLHVRLPRHLVIWIRAQAKRDGNFTSEQLAKIVQAALIEQWDHETKCLQAASVEGA